MKKLLIIAMLLVSFNGFGIDIFEKSHKTIPPTITGKWLIDVIQLDDMDYFTRMNNYLYATVTEKTVTLTNGRVLEVLRVDEHTNDGQRVFIIFFKDSSIVFDYTVLPKGQAGLKVIENEKENHRAILNLDKQE